MLVDKLPFWYPEHRTAMWHFNTTGVGAYRRDRLLTKRTRRFGNKSGELRV
ncbi:hypothetical protein J5I95_13745 [Candidatus Poribacteria bacterium]|nr:hypothetical protein [Candidatus Poribacteria bacterium]